MWETVLNIILILAMLFACVKYTQVKRALKLIVNALDDDYITSEEAREIYLALRDIVSAEEMQKVAKFTELW